MFHKVLTVLIIFWLIFVEVKLHKMEDNMDSLRNANKLLAGALMELHNER